MSNFPLWETRSRTRSWDAALPKPSIKSLMNRVPPCTISNSPKMSAQKLEQRSSRRVSTIELKNSREYQLRLGKACRAFFIDTNYLVRQLYVYQCMVTSEWSSTVLLQKRVSQTRWWIFSRDLLTIRRCRCVSLLVYRRCCC